MRYPAFVHWAGFLLPDFTEYEQRVAGSEQDMLLREEIEDYTQIRIGSAQDIYLLICHAISESLAENTNNIGFSSKQTLQIGILGTFYSFTPCRAKSNNLGIGELQLFCLNKKLHVLGI